MFYGWYDPNPKKPTRQKLAEGIARYEEKFGRVPLYCLTSGIDAADLADPTKKHPGELPVQVQSRGYIARHVYYISEHGEDIRREAIA